LPCSWVSWPRTPPLFPYATLFRSRVRRWCTACTPPAPWVTTASPPQPPRPVRHAGWDHPPAASNCCPLRQSPCRRDPPPAPQTRSEEHTSELQSRENLVCRLLLEK